MIASIDWTVTPITVIALLVVALVAVAAWARARVQRARADFYRQMTDETRHQRPAPRGRVR